MCRAGPSARAGSNAGDGQAVSKGGGSLGGSGSAGGNDNAPMCAAAVGAEMAEDSAAATSHQTMTSSRRRTVTCRA